MNVNLRFSSFCLTPEGTDVEIEPVNSDHAKSEGESGERHCHFHAGVEYAGLNLRSSTQVSPNDEAGTALEGPRRTCQHRLLAVNGSTETTTSHSELVPCSWC